MANFASRSARAAGRISIVGCRSWFFTVRSIRLAASPGRVAVNSPAYLIWSPQDDRAAEQAFAAIAAAMHKKFGRILVIDHRGCRRGSRSQKARSSFTAFDIRVGAAGGAERAAQRSIACARHSARSGSTCVNRKVVTGEAELPAIDLGSTSSSIVCRWWFPQIHRLDEQHVLPAADPRSRGRSWAMPCSRRPARSCLSSGAGAPAHFRSLGRSAFLAAALDADKKLDKVARSFDFLLSVSPINSREAMERFFAAWRARSAEIPLPAADRRS